MSCLMTREEFGEAYENGRIQTVHFLISKGLHEDDAKEKAQAAWVKGWEKRSQIRNKKKALAWVNTIAFNLYRNSYRRNSKYEHIRECPIEPRIDIDAVDLGMKFNQCRKNDCEILKLRYFIGLDIKELALYYNCTENAIRVKLLRARRSLKAQYPTWYQPTAAAS